MAAIDIIGGPSKDELVSRMLSHLPVTFLTSGGPTEILIEEIQETDASGLRLAFRGRIVFGASTGVRVAGQYDCRDMTGMMDASANGV
jgi:hypothetical protein